MFKKRIWKPLLIGLGWTLSLAGLVVLMSFIEVKKAEVVCKSVKVYIPGSQYFIDRQEVDNILQMTSHSLVGKKIENIDLHALENKLKRNPFVEFAKVYADMDGVIQVEVSQRQPILRIMNRFDQDFYVDQHGLKMPLSETFTARVIAANGFIDELFANKVDSLHNGLAKDIFKTANFIRADSLWDAQIAQIYVNENREIELIPRVGNQRILLGNADSLELKFGNLKAFYKKALPIVGWDAYRVINIKYSNQVVGVKNQTLMDSLAAQAKEKSRAEERKSDSLHMANLRNQALSNGGAEVTGGAVKAVAGKSSKAAETKVSGQTLASAAKITAKPKPKVSAGTSAATPKVAAKPPEKIDARVNPDALYKPKAKAVQPAAAPKKKATAPAASKPAEKKKTK